MKGGGMACEVGKDQRKPPWEGRAKRLRGSRGWGGMWIVDEVREGMGVSDAAAFTRTVAFTLEW